MIVVEGRIPPEARLRPPTRWARIRARIRTFPTSLRQGWTYWLLTWGTLAAVEAGRRRRK